MGDRRNCFLNEEMSLSQRVLWYAGWNPQIACVTILGPAGLGWLLTRSPLGLAFGVVGLLFWQRAIRFVNRESDRRKQRAEARIASEAVAKLNISSEAARYILRIASGSSPFGIKGPPTLNITAAFLCDTFFVVYPGAVLRLANLSLQFPEGSEEIYYRYVIGIDYRPPLLQLHLPNKRTKQLNIGGDQCDALVSDLRARLRGVTTFDRSPGHRTVSSRGMGEANSQADPTSAPAEGVLVPDSRPAAQTARLAPQPELLNTSGDAIEPRHCYLRLSKLQKLYNDVLVLDTLMEMLEVPGKPSLLKQLTAAEKQQAIEAQIEHFRKSPTSVWYDVPDLEVLAASIWRAGADGDFALTRKMVREIFGAVSREDDLRHPVARWLQNRGHEPYMEVPLGRRRIDLLGVSGRKSLLAVELKNEDEQFSRAIDQMGTFAEYAHAVYTACTPAFAADYLDRNTESRGVQRWDPGLLDRKLTAGGYGLLIVERDSVFEVIKPGETTPSQERVADALRSLSSVMRVEC
jgi:hypothetical protein